MAENENKLPREVEALALPLENMFVTISGGDLFRLLAAKAILQEQALLNPITGLPNARATEDFIARTQREFIRVKTNPCVTILDMDLVHFKDVNSTYGDLTGDEVLRIVGEAMQEQARPSDFLGNPRGDQYYLIAIGVGAEAAEKLKERYITALEPLEIPAVTKAGKLQVIKPQINIKSITVPGNSDFGAIFDRISRDHYEKPRENGK